MTTPRVWRGVLDTLEIALALYDDEGTLVHQNQAFSRLVVQAEEVHGVAACVARDVWVGAQEIEITGPTTVEESIATAELRTTDGHFRLKGSYVETRTRAGTVRGIAVVAVRNAVSDRLSETVLQEQFGLTRQEARVVGLLARGRSNKQISRLLGISTHTARHHVERVLKKLAVSKRSQVPGQVMGLAQESQ